LPREIAMNSINIDHLKKVLYVFPKLVLGLFLCGLGIVTMLMSNIGLNPWGTLSAGLVNVTSISFGQWSQIIGLAIIVFTMFLKVVPGIATILNMYLIGFFMDLILESGLMPSPENVFFQISMNLAGLFIFSLGIYMYLSCGLGAGPRDGLMIALMRLTNKSVTIIKTSIEVTVTVLGIMMGGPLGIGTIMAALLGGKILDLVLGFFNYDPKEKRQMDFLDLYKFITENDKREGISTK